MGILSNAWKPLLREPPTRSRHLWPPTKLKMNEILSGSKWEKNSYEFLGELCVLLIRAWVGRMSSRNERERKKNLLNSVLTKKEEHSGRQSILSNRISGLQSTVCFSVFYFVVIVFLFFCEALRSFLCSRGRRRSRLRLVTFERPRVRATMGNKGR